MPEIRDIIWNAEKSNKTKKKPHFGEAFLCIFLFYKRSFVNGGTLARAQLANDFYGVISRSVLRKIRFAKSVFKAQFMLGGSRCPTDAEDHLFPRSAAKHSVNIGNTVIGCYRGRFQILRGNCVALV